MILCTTGGVRALLACEHASLLLASSLVCASATAALLRAMAPVSLGLVVTGTGSDRDGDEDHACADLIEALLRGRDPAREPYAARVRQSDFGRRFAAGLDPHLPQADLDCCAQVDRFEFALRVEKTARGSTLQRTSGAACRPDAYGASRCR